MSPPESSHPNEGDKKTPTEGAGAVVDHGKETAERKDREAKEAEDRKFDSINADVIKQNIENKDDPKVHSQLWAIAEFEMLYPAPKDERPEAKEARMVKLQELKDYYAEQFQDPKKLASKRDMSVADKEAYLRGLMKSKAEAWETARGGKHADYLVMRALAKIQGYQGSDQLEAFVHSPDGAKHNTPENIAILKELQKKAMEKKAKESSESDSSPSKPATAPAPTPPSTDSPSTLKSFFESIGGFWGAVGLGILAFLGLQKGNDGKSLFENLFTSVSDSLGFGKERKKAEREAREQKRVAEVLGGAGIPVNTNADTAQSSSGNGIAIPEKADQVREMVPYLKPLAKPEGVFAQIEGKYEYQAGDAGTLKRVMTDREPEKNTARLTTMAEEFMRTANPAHRTHRDFMEFVDKQKA